MANICRLDNGVKKSFKTSLVRFCSPNFLTGLRLMSIPVIVICFYVNSRSAFLFAFFIFAFACITDFLDGYIARQYYATSKLGEFLDPIADKVLVSCILLMLAGFQYISGFNLIPAIIILSREILISGMREFLSEIQIPMPVSKLAKAKTALQMFSLCLIMYGLYDNILLPSGLALLWGSAVLTVITGWKYLIICIKNIS